jgi:hypothetical protein
MIQPKCERKPRVKMETVYRVRWSAGDTDLPTKERADEQVLRLMAAGVVATVDTFKRPKQ